MKHNVLITTSGIGSRLGSITKYVNKSLVRVGDKAIISHIIDLYPKDTRFIITLGFKGDLVRQYVEFCHANNNIEFVEVDTFDGPGSSQLYSMLKAKDHLQKPFIFHVADCIIKDKFYKKINHKKNTLLGSKFGDSTIYASFNLKDDSKILTINNKGQMDPDLMYIGVVYIADYEKFWKKAIELQSLRPDDTSLNDIKVFQKIMFNTKFDYRVVNDWYDTGSVKGLSKSREEFKSNIFKEVLDKEEEDIFSLNGNIIKFFLDEQILENRVLRNSILKNTVPEILKRSKNFYSYKIFEGSLYSKVADHTNIKSFLNFGYKNLWSLKEETDSEFIDLSKKFYYNKTLIRINKFFEKYNIIDSESIINNYKIPSVKTLINQIPESFYSEGEKTVVHGDFILENCIYNNKEFKLIDWRQDFAGDINHGDCYYDFSKLFHNLTVNHEIVMQDLFKVEETKKNIKVDIYRKNNLIECEEIFLQWIDEKGYSRKRVNVLRALIWINMSPLHHYPFDKFLFYFGKLNLYKSLNYEN